MLTVYHTCVFHAGCGWKIMFTPLGSFICLALSLSGGGLSVAHQVPAVSQSAYSPSSPDTPDSRFSGSPHMMLSKPGPPPPPPPPPPPLMTLPPTQPTAKVLTYTYFIIYNQLIPIKLK